MGSFKKVDHVRQGFLLPPSPNDWLPPGHLAWFVSDAVDALDVEPILVSYRTCGKGELAYPPRLMLKLLIYAYCVGVFSSRKIAKAVHENVAFRVLACGEFPSHRTIARFREMHIDTFKHLFVKVMMMAAESGLTKLGTVAVDGSKIKADASKHKAMSYKRMQEEEARLLKEIEEITRAAADEDRLEDAKFGEHFKGDELPEELQIREKRLAKIQAAKKRLEERKAAEAEAAANAPLPSTAPAAEKPQDDGAAQADDEVETVDQPESVKADGPEPVKPKPKDQENFTDPDSRIMKVGSGAFEQCYNAQIAVDEGRFIVAALLSQSAADSIQLVPMIDAVAENTGALPARLLADAGYRSESNFETAAQRGVDAYIPLGREGKAPKRPSDLPQSAAMAEKLKTPEGRERYRARKLLVEPVFGWIKRVLGFRSFSLRGRRKVTGEWLLVCMAMNLRRMAAMQAI